MDYASSVQAVALRLCRLGQGGAPLPGLKSAFVTSQFTQVSWTPQYKTGEEMSQTAADGTECAYYKMPDTLQKVNLNIAICNPQPEVYELLAGGAVLLGQTARDISNAALANNVATLTSNAHGLLAGDLVTVAGVGAPFNGSFVLTAVTANTFSYAKANADVASAAATGTASGPDHTSGAVGYQGPTKDEVPNENGLGLEVWSKRILEGRPAAVPFWRWVFPFTTYKMDGERTLSNGILANSFSGEGLANTAFGSGPADDWDFGGVSALQYAQDDSAPTGVNDYVAVA